MSFFRGLQTYSQKISSQTPALLTSASDDYGNHISDDVVKKLVMEHGGVAICYQAEDDGENGPAYYYSESGKSGNHEVVIVGWDDNYSAYAANVFKVRSDNETLAVSVKGSVTYPNAGYHTLKMTDENAVSLTKRVFL